MKTQPYLRKTHFYETDQMGIIHHANYIRWFEEARIDLLEQIGVDYQGGVAPLLDFAVLQVSCDYKSMVRFGETVAIHCQVRDVKAMRMTLGYCILDAATGVVRTTGESKHCFFSRTQNRPVSLKRELPALYDLFVSLVPEDESSKPAAGHQY